MNNNGKFGIRHWPLRLRSIVDGSEFLFQKVLRFDILT